MCDQSAEQQRDGLIGRQELAMSTLRCRRGLPYEAKSLPSGEEREYHVRVGVPNRKFWLRNLDARSLMRWGEVSQQQPQRQKEGSRLDDTVQIGFLQIQRVNNLSSSRQSWQRGSSGRVLEVPLENLSLEVEEVPFRFGGGLEDR